MSSSRFLPIGLLAASVAAAACTATPSVSADLVQTAVAATLSAASAPIDTVAAPTSEEHALPTSPPTTPAPRLFLAYTDGGNVAYLAEGAAPVALTSAGGVEQVRLSDDGLKIAYTRRPIADQPVELHIVNPDGTGDALLMGPSDFDALYPLGGAVHHDLSQFDFIPGTHQLLLNTRSIFVGPGLAKHDDLIRIDVDTMARTTLLAPGAGGDFTASPNGQYLAVVRPPTVEIRLADGSPSGSGTITYDSVITYSEYAYYAKPVWNPESTMIGLAIPSHDPLAAETSATTWHLPVGGAPTLVATIAGQFFFPSFSVPLVSADLSQVAFTRPTTTPNVSNLYRASFDGSGETSVGTYGSWNGWSPDSAHFVFSPDDPMNLQLGDLAGGVAPLVSGTDLVWFDPTQFVYLSGSGGSWALNRGGIGSPSTVLATPAGSFVNFDVAYR